MHVKIVDFKKESFSLIFFFFFSTLIKEGWKKCVIISDIEVLIILPDNGE